MPDVTTSTTPAPKALAGPRVVISQFAIREKLEAELAKYLAPKRNPINPGNELKMLFGDSNYYCPTQKAVYRFLRRAGTDEYDPVKGRTAPASATIKALKFDWFQQVFDCDDFALLAKAAYAVHAHGLKREVMKKRRVVEGAEFAPFCVGIAWGRGDGQAALNDGDHALNWVLCVKQQHETNLAFASNSVTDTDLLFFEPQGDVGPIPGKVPPVPTGGAEEEPWPKLIPAAEVGFAEKSITFLYA